MTGLEGRIETYFKACRESGKPTDLADLARHIRVPLEDLFPDRRDSQPDSVQHALTRLEADLNARALLGQCSPEDAMRDLIQYFGWRA
jgi:hypothetical protein